MKVAKSCLKKTRMKFENLNLISNCVSYILCYLEFIYIYSIYNYSHKILKYSALFLFISFIKFPFVLLSSDFFSFYLHRFNWFLVIFTFICYKILFIFNLNGKGYLYIRQLLSLSVLLFFLLLLFSYLYIVYIFILCYLININFLHFFILLFHTRSFWRILCSNNVSSFSFSFSLYLRLSLRLLLFPSTSNTMKYHSKYIYTNIIHKIQFQLSINSTQSIKLSLIKSN